MQGRRPLADRLLLCAVLCGGCGPKGLSCLVSAGSGWWGSSLLRSSTASPQPWPCVLTGVFSWSGSDLYLLSRDCPSTGLLLVAVFPCFPCFLNILFVSLRNIISGKKLSPVDLKGQKWVVGLFTPLPAGTRACQKVIYALCASSD